MPDAKMTEGERIAKELLDYFYIDPPAVDATAHRIDAALAAKDAKIGRLRETLVLAGALIADNRQLIVDSESIGGDESTMDAEAKEAMVPFDTVLTKIAALLGEGE